MSTYESALLRLLDERGHIHQVTDPVALDKLASEQVVTAYVGFDPTAPVAVRRTVLRTLDLPDSAPAESTTVAANREVTYTRSPSSTSAPAGGARRNGC